MIEQETHRAKAIKQTLNQRIVRHEILEQKILEIEKDLAKKKVALKTHKVLIANLKDNLTNLGVAYD
ncbi:hypothetical protein KAR91_69445 [Candidatus Pacearchaeota archaeon]|nr:hypothetical protein [Candidatus Pacearchaeota archaeon]